MKKELVRIGFIADTHNEQYDLMRRAIIQMKSQVGEVKHLFHLGDFLDNYNETPSNFPYVPYRTTARKLKQIKEEFGVESVHIIPGNHDIIHPTYGLCELEELSIHKRKIKIGDYTFLGYGGGYNFVKLNGWSEYYKQRYKISPSELDKLLDDVDVLLLHQLEGKRKGQTLRPVIEKYKPRIVLTGHTHKHGVEFYERPMYASCGPIQPLDQTNFKRMGKSSFGVLEIGGEIDKIMLFFFKKGRNGDSSQLDAEIAINPVNY